MMSSSRLGILASTVCLFVSAHAGAPALSGAIFTTDQNGTLVNGNTQYLSKCGATGVYLDGGPGPNAPATAASLADGDYYFQVTDPSGKTLLSTDPVSKRCFTVASGVISGACPTGNHATFTDQDQASRGARVVELCAAPEVPFLNTTNEDGVYKVWVTPVGDGTSAGGGFVGDPNLVDNDCNGVKSCFHGFVASRSKTDNFKAPNTVVTPPDPGPGSGSCIVVEKQITALDVPNFPGVNWRIMVTDANGVTNAYFTDELGTTGSQICGLAAGSYTVSEEIQGGSFQVERRLNGEALDRSSESVEVVLGSSNQTVLFINQFSSDT
jgi:hypothetical protein